MNTNNITLEDIRKFGAEKLADPEVAEDKKQILQIVLHLLGIIEAQAAAITLADRAATGLREDLEQIEREINQAKADAAFAAFYRARLEQIATKQPSHWGKSSYALAQEAIDTTDAGAALLARLSNAEQEIERLRAEACKWRNFKTNEAARYLLTTGFVPNEQHNALKEKLQQTERECDELRQQIEIARATDTEPLRRRYWSALGEVEEAKKQIAVKDEALRRVRHTAWEADVTLGHSPACNDLPFGHYAPDCENIKCVTLRAIDAALNPYSSNNQPVLKEQNPNE